MITAAFI